MHVIYTFAEAELMKAVLK